MASKINVDKIARGSGTPEFTIPTADGAADTFLKTDGSGVLSFDTVTTTALTGSTNTWIPTITGANALTGTANFTYDGNTLDVKNSGTASTLKLYCESSNAHYQAIKAAPHSGSSDWTLTLPSTVPTTSGQVLSATTAGVASWAGNSPAWFVYLNGDQSPISNATNTRIEVNTEVYDTDSAFTTTGLYGFTCPAGQAGKYFVYGQIIFTNSGTGNIGLMKIMIFKGGSAIAVTQYEPTYNNDTESYTMNIQLPLVLAAGDVIDLRGYISSSTGTNTVDGFNGEYNVFFGGHKLIGI